MNRYDLVSRAGLEPATLCLKGRKPVIPKLLETRANILRVSILASFFLFLLVA